MAVFLLLRQRGGHHWYIGALVGFKALTIGHVKSPIAQGLSMGAASHAVGASTAMAYSSKYGAFAIGITLMVFSLPCYSNGSPLDGDI